MYDPYWQSNFVMFEYLQADYGGSFLQNKCFPNLTLSYPVQHGNRTVSQGNYYPHVRSNAALLTDDKNFGSTK